MPTSKQCSVIGRYLPVLATAALALGLAAPPALADQQAFVQEADSPQLDWGPCPEFMPAGCSIAVLRGDPAKPRADILFKLPSGTTAPEHWHSSAERMVLIAGRMEVRYEGQQPATLDAGTYAYGPPEVVHEATCNSRQDCVLFIAFNEPVDAFASDR